MSSTRQLSPWYWVMFGVVLFSGALFVSNLVLDWAPSWLSVSLLLVPLAGIVFTWRMLRKQSDSQAPGTQAGTANKRPWTVERIRATYCLILLPILTATATAAVIFALVDEGLIALASGVGTLAGIAALVFLLYTAPRVAAADAEGPADLSGGAPPPGPMAHRLGFWYVLLAAGILLTVGAGLLAYWGSPVGWVLIVAGLCNTFAAAVMVVGLHRKATGAR